MVHNSLYVPRDVFTAQVGRIEMLSGMHIPGDAALAALYTRHLANCIAAAPRLSAAEAESMMDGALHLLSRLVASRLAHEGERRRGEPLSRDGLLALADRHIEASLGDPALDAVALARATCVSRSRLYEAFAECGGVSAAIRDARLDRARPRVASPGDRHRTLEEVALACGFAEYSSITRAFRRRFGLSPRDARGP